jgi:acetaldehyde dehydrogenase/alcohol dehydrogenase
MDGLVSANTGIQVVKPSHFPSTYTQTTAACAGYEEKIQTVKLAQQQFAEFNQNQVDNIFATAARAAALHSRMLAEYAVAETGMGVVDHKEHKNLFASEVIYTRYKDQKTADIILEDKINGITKFAEPVGVIAGIVPVTNPTSTAIFKALLTLKTRNGIIFFPHPRAKKCTVKAARIVLEAAVDAGAPAGIFDWIDEPTIEITSALIRHDDISLILATGGPGVVRAAYYSGKPAIGVGSGNTPAIIDKSADIVEAVESIVTSKVFDNGLICASEQSVIVDRELYDSVKALLKEQGAYVLSREECARLRGVIDAEGKLNPRIVRTVRGENCGNGNHQCAIGYQGIGFGGGGYRTLRAALSRETLPSTCHVPRRQF